MVDEARPLTQTIFTATRAGGGRFRLTRAIRLRRQRVLCAAVSGPRSQKAGKVWAICAS
jgi:hypothetical protein